MGNAVTAPKAASVAGLSNIAAGLKRARSQMPSLGGKPYLKYGKDGEWTVGKNSDAMNGEKLILNVSSVRAGYVCWTDYDKKEKKKNERLGEEMVLVSQGSVDRSSLPDHGWPWKEQQSVEGRFLTGDKSEFVYNVSSIGGLGALDEVMGKVVERIEAGEDTFLYPIIELGAEWYDHTSWGKTYTPLLEVVGWAAEDGTPEGDFEDDNGEDPAENGAADDGEGDEGEDDGPVRRRRR